MLRNRPWTIVTLLVAVHAIIFVFATAISAPLSRLVGSTFVPTVWAVVAFLAVLFYALTWLRYGPASQSLKPQLSSGPSAADSVLLWLVRSFYLVMFLVLAVAEVVGFGFLVAEPMGFGQTAGIVAAALYSPVGIAIAWMAPDAVCGMLGTTLRRVLMTDIFQEMEIPRAPK